MMVAEYFANEYICYPVRSHTRDKRFSIAFIVATKCFWSQPRCYSASEMSVQLVEKNH